jgi:hypothetical protein
MIHKNRNLSNTALARYLGEVTVSNGDTFENCNLSRWGQETLFTGITGLTFKNCNLMNCTVPGDAVIEDCLQIQKSICTNILDKKGITHSLPPCAVNCSHVVDTDTVTIDSVLIFTEYYYKHTLL